MAILVPAHLRQKIFVSTLHPSLFRPPEMFHCYLGGHKGKTAPVAPFSRFLFLFIGMDLFSNCTEECKALGHSDRCWMPSFVPSDGRQAADYRSNLHVPGMDSVPDTEVFETPEAQPGTERSFSTFGKEKALHSTLERKELDGLLSSTRAPYKPPYLSKYCTKGCIKVFPLRK
jgi:hypothetical protein